MFLNRNGFEKIKKSPVVLSRGDVAGDVAQNATAALDDRQRLGLGLVGQHLHEQ